MFLSSHERKPAQAHELDAAVMVVDVSGFSGMCERFAQGLVPDGGWRQRMKVFADACVDVRALSSRCPFKEGPLRA